ncbi:EF-Tu/IF-2/RF-3 family GTPase [Robinsoniella sp. RHS]|uniref:elongation factor 1-alpha C-terminal domain-related protein n=1 Tax=Robinsoniella sp. RHS TaxID=1504536 RepID=UPI00375381F8
MYIPISGYKGENIVQKSKNMTWYEGDTVLEVLEKFQVEKLPANKPFRMPVQGVYKFTAGGDTRRIIGGTVETGTLNVGDEVVFFPSGKKGRIKSIEAFNEDTKISVCAGYSTGFTLTEQIYVKRGEIATVSDQLKPQIATLIKVKLFWLSKLAMVMGKTYILKLGTSKVRIRIVKIISILDASTLQSSNSDFIGTNDVAECLLELEKPIAFDLLSYNFYLSRFVIIDHYEISGGGTIYGISEDKQNWISEKTITGNNKWENSAISEAERALKYQQNPTLIMITGLSNGGKKYISSILEKKLFNQGRIVYLLSIYYKEEHLRRLAEISNIMLDAGNILIVTVVEMSNDDLKEIKTIVDPKKIKVLWIGNNITTDIEYDLQISEDCEGEYALNIIEDYLIKSSVISSDNGKD